VALARALVLRPTLIVADEAVSMLDPSEQAKMIQLLKQLQVDRGMAMIFISHDLSVVLRVADRVLAGCRAGGGGGFGRYPAGFPPPSRHPRPAGRQWPRPPLLP